MNIKAGVSGDTPICFKYNGKVVFKTMEELCRMNLEKTEVLTVNDDREIIWSQPKEAVVNEEQPLYRVNFRSNRSFVCNENMNLITHGAMNPKNIMDLAKRSHLLGVNGKVGFNELKPDLSSILYGFYLGDGDKTTKRARLRFKKVDKADYIKNVLDSLNVEYNRTLTNDDYFNFYFDRKHLIEPDLTDKNQLAGLLCGFISSDGYVYISGQIKKTLYLIFSNTELELIRLFKYVCFMFGLPFSTNISNYVTKDGECKEEINVNIKCSNNLIDVVKQLNFRSKQQEVIDKAKRNYKEIKETIILQLNLKKPIEPLNTKAKTYNLIVDGNLIVGDDFLVVGDGQ